MIPFTPPCNTTFKVKTFTLASLTGLTRWVDYIPVKEVTPGRVDSYDNNGAVSVAPLANETGSIRWVDHLPVGVVADADSGKWRTDNAGFIPVDGLS